MAYEKTEFVDRSAPYIDADFLNSLQDALIDIDETYVGMQADGRVGAIAELNAENELKAVRKIVVGTTDPSEVTGLLPGDIYIYCPDMD